MATRKLKKAFKLMQFQYVAEEIEKFQNGVKQLISVMKREYVCVNTGLSWSDAQDARRKDQSLIIVQEARVYKKRAKKAKKVEVAGEPEVI